MYREGTRASRTGENQVYETRCRYVHAKLARKRTQVTNQLHILLLLHVFGQVY